MWRVGGNCWIFNTASEVAVSRSSWIKRWPVLWNKQFHSSPPAAFLPRLWLMTHSQIEPVRRNKGRFQAEIWERAGVNEKSGRALSQQDQTITLPVLFSVHLHVDIWTDLKMTRASKLQPFLENCYSCCQKCSYVIDIRTKRKKSKQTAVTSVISVCASQCLWWVDRWMDGWLRRAGRQSASGQHAAPL